VNGIAATKYTSHNQASGGDATVWIAREMARAQIRARFEGRLISSRYEYSNVQALPTFTSLTTDVQRNEYERALQVAQHIAPSGVVTISLLIGSTALTAQSGLQTVKDKTGAARSLCAKLDAAFNPGYANSPQRTTTS